MYQHERMDEILKIVKKNHYVTVDYLVKEIRGDYLNVVGFPLADFCHTLKKIM